MGYFADFSSQSKVLTCNYCDSNRWLIRYEKATTCFSWLTLDDWMRYDLFTFLSLLAYKSGFLSIFAKTINMTL